MERLQVVLPRPVARDPASTVRVYQEVLAQLLRSSVLIGAEAVTWLSWSPTPDQWDGGAATLEVREAPGDGKQGRYGLVLTDGQGRRLASGELAVTSSRGRSRSGNGDAPTVELPLGARGEGRFRVEPEHLTAHIAGVAPLLATPALISFMEQAAADLVAPVIPPGFATVGTWIDVRHTGGAYRDETVVVRATYVHRSGAQLYYEVEAVVDDRRLGRGRVAHAVVAIDQLQVGRA